MRIQAPSSLHMLDKAVWLVTCLHEVIFDLSGNTGDDFVTIRCTFIDGDVREWTFKDEQCMSKLQGVLKDVEWSHIQSQKEKYERQSLDSQRSEVSPSPSPSQKKHKKQRSLLMTLVSLVSPNSSHSRGSSREPSPPPSICPTFPDVPEDLSSHHLRRRARASLIDAFRRVIYSEFSAYFPCIGSGFGFLTWVVRSNLRQIDEKLETLLRQTGLAGETRFKGRRNHHALPESPFFDDEEVEETSLESRSTDTDGSSVHTPTEHATVPLNYFNGKSRPVPNCPRSPTPPSPPSSDTMNLLHALSNQSEQLQQLLSQLHHARLATEADEKQVLAILEIKSRRTSLEQPRNVIAAADLEMEASRNHFLCGVDELDVHDLERKMKGLNVASPSSMLFPVVEEEEYEEHSLLMPGGESLTDIPLSPDTSDSWSEDSDDGTRPTVRLVEDAENGYLQPLPFATPPTSPTSSCFPGSPQYAHRQSQQTVPTLASLPPGTPVRARTKSMLVRTPPSEGPESRSQAHAMPHANHPALLHVFNPQTKIEIFDVSYDSDEEAESDSEHLPLSNGPYSNPNTSIMSQGSESGDDSQEFTLSMDAVDLSSPISDMSFQSCIPPPLSSSPAPSSPTSTLRSLSQPPSPSSHFQTLSKKTGILHEDWLISVDSEARVEVEFNVCRCAVV
ncbi:hypothetical protein QCA50_016596 [Cerrena zonata]|uniref:Uncharacterized protein n=1 Tax=Cerrena zonata TaxID=2478898 RepID=A0AAW0FSL2_9APHY